MKKKWIIITSVSVILFGAWLVGVIRLNVAAEKPQKEVYQVGERVYYGNNYFEYSSEIMDGYSLEVLSAKVYEYDAYLEKMGIETDPTTKWRAEYVFDLEIRFYNSGGTDGKGGVPFISTYLASTDDRLTVNSELVGAMYPHLGEDPYGFSIRPETEMILHLPYQMEWISWLYVGDEKDYLEESDFYLNVTQYPVKQVVFIRDGAGLPT